MTKKVLNIDAITNELEGASLFFAKPSGKTEEPKKENNKNTPPPRVEYHKQPVNGKTEGKIINSNTKRNTAIPRYHDTMTPRDQDAAVELVRKAVKDFGKEAATDRFTLAEKKAIADIIYTYRSGGIRTSENEIARIAVNHLIEDFKENGEASVLDKVLRALTG